MRRILLLAALAIVPASVRAQVMIAPTAVFMSPASPFGSYLVINQGTVPQELTVGFRFGYPTADTTGEVIMVYGDSLPLAPRSMQGWVSAFPRQFVLRPGERQIVRVFTRPPAGRSLSDGIYWTRIVTTSTPQAVLIDSVNPGVTAAVKVRFEQITTVLFKVGGLSTALAAAAPTIRRDSTHVYVRLPLTLGGNAPFLGKLSLAILDATGKAVATETETVSTYLSGPRRYVFEGATLPAGRYTLQVLALTERGDLPREDLVQAPPYSARFPIEIP